MSEELTPYIKAQVGRGVKREEIKSILVASGWKEKDIDTAFASVAPVPAPDVSAAPPPKPPAYSLVEIFVGFFSFLLLGTVAISTGTLLFQIVNKYFPDPLASVNYVLALDTSAIHYAIAALIVSFPLYVWAVWFWFTTFRADAEKGESRLTKWLTYIVLLIAAVTVVGDLIVVIFNFLQGELSVRFILKALAVAAIAGMVFAFYFFERRKIQYKKEVSGSLFRALFGAACAIVVVSVVLGFFAGGTPGEERLRKFDQARASDLSQIAGGISSFASQNDRLPQSFDELKSNPQYSYSVSRTADPETGQEYEYRTLGKNAQGSWMYELCGVFSLSTKDKQQVSRYAYEFGQWTEHDAGRVCQTLTATVDKNNLLRTVPVVPN